MVPRGWTAAGALEFQGSSSQGSNLSSRHGNRRPPAQQKRRQSAGWLTAAPDADVPEYIKQNNSESACIRMSGQAFFMSPAADCLRIALPQFARDSVYAGDTLG